MSLKVFTGEYDQRWSYGGFEEIAATVVASTEKEALGLLLETFKESLAEHWTVKEVDMSDIGVDILHRRCS